VHRVSLEPNAITAYGAAARTSVGSRTFDSVASDFVLGRAWGLELRHSLFSLQCSFDEAQYRPAEHRQKAKIPEGFVRKNGRINKEARRCREPMLSSRIKEHL
jgi:hypothetical protein